MLTKALRLYGKNDLRVEEFDLPEMKDDEILAKVVSDSLCMSSYKAAIQGEDHKRVPKDIAQNPIILGHEFCGEIVKVGKKWEKDFKPGDRYIIQPALNYKGRPDSPGYNFKYCGGCATYVIFPPQVMESGCLLPYDMDAFFYGSLSEPVSCVIGSFAEFYHAAPGIHTHTMGVKAGGSLAILAGAGPMGLAATDYIVHCDQHPARVVVTDISEDRLSYARKHLPPENAAKNGVELIYRNTAGDENQKETLLSLNGQKGYDDVLAMAPVRSVVELGDQILGMSGCYSFFAGPSDHEFKAEINFYNIHYNFTHFIGTVGGNSEDMLESIAMMKKGAINPATLITHIGGLNCTAETTLNLPKIPGNKKLIYTHLELPLTAISEFAEKGKTDPMFRKLSEITERHNGLWCKEAEDYLLENAKQI